MASLELWLGIKGKHMAFLELWLEMTFLELWVRMVCIIDASCGSSPFDWAITGCGQWCANIVLRVWTVVHFGNST